MKKTVLMILIVCLCVGMCACSNNTAAAKSVEAQKADELILAIGEVSLDKEEKILAAQAYYDSLTDGQKAEVENYNILLDAVKKLERVSKLNEIELASIEEKWATVLRLSEEILENYPESSEAKTAQAYQNKAVQVIEDSAYKYLQAGELEEALALLTRIESYSEKAQALIPDVEEYIAIAGVYTAAKYYANKNGTHTFESKYRDAYYLTVVPFLNNDGEWCAEYTIELPGYFYMSSDKCYTHTCIGLLSNGKEPVVAEINPKISYHNDFNDTFELWKKDGGYYAEHFMYDDDCYYIFNLTFTR